MQNIGELKKEIERIFKIWPLCIQEIFRRFLVAQVKDVGKKFIIDKSYIEVTPPSNKMVGGK